MRGCAPGSSARFSVSASGTASNPPTGCDASSRLSMQVGAEKQGRAASWTMTQSSSRTRARAHAAHCAPNARAPLHLRPYRRAANGAPRWRARADRRPRSRPRCRRNPDPPRTRQRVLDDGRPTERGVLLGHGRGEPPAAARGRDDDEIAHAARSLLSARRSACVRRGCVGSAVRGRTGTT